MSQSENDQQLWSDARQQPQEGLEALISSVEMYGMQNGFCVGVWCFGSNLHDKASRDDIYIFDRAGKLMHFSPWEYNVQFQQKEQLQQWDVYSRVRSALDCDCACEGPAISTEMY